MKKRTNLVYLLGIILFACSCNSKQTEEIKLFPVKSGENYQYVDKDGKIIINPQFAEASIFRDGIALVKSSGDKGKWGYIGTDGKYIINANYKSATVFKDGLAWVVAENGAPTAINDDGETKFTLQNAEAVRVFSEKLAAFSQVDTSGTKWGFVDTSGKIVITCQFDAAGNFNNGKCPVKNKDGKWGYINKEGKIDINYQFDYAGSFENGKAVVGLKDKAGVIDENGKYVINPQFADMSVDGENYIIKQDDKWGWSDKDGKILINPQFDYAGSFSGGNLAVIKSGENYGYIDMEGKISINPQFEEALPFNHDLAIVKSGDKYGIIDAKGKYVVNPQFDGVSYDLYFYLYSGLSLYGHVQTDYFDVAKITNSININNPEGLSVRDNIAKVLAKTGKTEIDLNRYSDYHELFTKDVTDDVSVTFNVYCNPFAYASAYSYYKEFRPSSVVEGFSYSFSLSGKASGKASELKKTFEKALKNMSQVKAGYTKDTPVTVLKDQNKYVIVTGKDDQLILHILNSGFDLTGYLSGITPNSSEDASAETTVETEVVAPEEMVDTTAAYDY